MQGGLSLRERLLVVMTAALLPLFGVGLWSAARENHSAAELAQSQLNFAASVLAANQDSAMEAAQQLLGAIAAVPQLHRMERERCFPYLKQLRAEFPSYTNIALFDPAGEPLCQAQGDRGPTVRDRDYFRRAVAERRFVVGEPITGRITGRAVLPFAMPVLEHGEVVAVALAALDLKHATEELAQVQLPEGAQVLVKDRLGNAVMQFPEGGDPLADDGQAPLVAQARSRIVGGQGFSVRVSLPRDALSRSAWTRVRDELAALAAVLGLAMAAVWWIGGRMIIKPAKQILGTARRIEQGRLDARVPVHAMGTRGEFARLGAAFNRMADSLQLRRAELEAELDRSRSAYAVLDNVLNSMQEGVIAVTDEGRFLIYNDAAARLFPLADAPMLPDLWPAHFGVYHLDRATLYRAEDLSLVRATLGHSGRSQIFVRNALVPEGRVLQCSAQPLHGGSLRGGLVVFTDLTQLQRLEAEQAAQLAQLIETQRKLLESQRIGRVGNWELDLRSGRLWWSQQVYELFGIAEADFDGTLNGFEQRVHPDDRPRLKPARDRALLEGQVLDLEYRIVRPDGSVAWMHEIAETRRGPTGDPVWFGGVVQDVTQRKQHEDAIEASRRELEAYTQVLQRVPEAAQAISAQPTLEATLREVARQACWVLGTRAATVTLPSVGAPVAHEVEPGAPGCAELAVPIADARGGPAGELRLAGKPEGAFGERERYVAMELAQFASIAIDNARLLTEVRDLNASLETRIAERTAQLATSNHELEAFSYSVSHDLRAPLGAISGFSKALEGKVQELADDRTLHYLARIQAGVAKMEELIEAMLQLSRVTRAQLQWAEVDLSAIARETVENLQLQEPERAVAVHIEEGLSAMGDARLLRAALENLIGNAWKFSSGAAQARIEVGRAGDAFFVRDNGVGFDMAYADKLFSAFHRLHRESEFPGTGIGLATVRRVIARHHGQVWAESRPGEGAVFYFTLAAAPA